MRTAHTTEKSTSPRAARTTKRTRRFFDYKTKLAAVQAVARGTDVTEVARQYAATTHMIKAWAVQLGDVTTATDTVPPVRSISAILRDSPTPTNGDLVEQLKAENRRLRVELEIVLQAIADGRLAH